MNDGGGAELNFKTHERSLIADPIAFIADVRKRVKNSRLGNEPSAEKEVQFENSPINQAYRATEAFYSMDEKEQRHASCYPNQSNSRFPDRGRSVGFRVNGQYMLEVCENGEVIMNRDDPGGFMPHAFMGVTIRGQTDEVAPFNTPHDPPLSPQYAQAVPIILSQTAAYFESVNRESPIPMPWSLVKDLRINGFTGPDQMKF